MLLVSLVACSGSVSEDSFLEEYAAAYCAFQDTCYRAEFLESYDDVDECVDDSLEDYEDVDVDGCEFDRDEARACLDDLRAATDDCDVADLLDADCDEVFDCGDDGTWLRPAGTPCDQLLTMYTEECGLDLTTTSTPGTTEVDCSEGSLYACYSQCGLDAGCELFQGLDPSGQVFQAYEECISACER